MDKRIEELEALAEEEGIVLPMTPEEIVQEEDKGNVVDLITGEVIQGGADLYIDSEALETPEPILA